MTSECGFSLLLPSTDIVIYMKLRRLTLFLSNRLNVYDPKHSCKGIYTNVVCDNNNNSKVETMELLSDWNYPKVVV